MKVLITGVSGYLARIVAQQLSTNGHQVVGIDHRPWFDCPPEIRLEKLDIRKRPTADLFRQFRPQVVVHMATETYVSATTEERYRLNLNGTQSIWSYCERFKVKQALFVGRHTVYGAADAPLYRKETEPLLAGTTFPTLADLVSADLYAGQALWRTPKLKTAVLRIAYPLGPMGRGTLANYLGGPRVPMVLGFDPLFQCIHTEDAPPPLWRHRFKSLGHLQRRRTISNPSLGPHKRCQPAGSPNSRATFAICTRKIRVKPFTARKPVTSQVSNRDRRFSLQS